MADILFQSASTAAQQIRQRAVSSRELVEAAFDRIDTGNHTLNAVVELRREDAAREAAAADEAIAQGRELGPLHGVPMTIKESFDVAGMHTTWGEPALADHVADSDATVVRRLRDAGAIVIGKTNVPHMLADFGQTANDLYGATSNPWDDTRTTGGSSGGSAAAVAAGMAFLEYGSDLVGSIRIPASFCGVYGLRPSVSTVPLAGMQPPGQAASPDEVRYLVAAGPLARSAEDLSAALRVTAGPEEPAARAYRWHLPPARQTRLAGLRVGVVLDHAEAPVSSEVGGPLSDAVDALARAGATVVEGWPEGVDPRLTHRSFGFHVQLFMTMHEPGVRLEAPGEYVEHEWRRMADRAAWAEHFRDIDVFLCPTNFTAAITPDSRPFEQRMVTTPEGDRPYHAQAFWASLAALPGLPAVSAPVGRTSAGLPVGVQIVGPLFEDDTPITVARLLSEEIGGYEPPPR